MKHYVSQKLKWNEIQGFQPGCSDEFSNERIEQVKKFIKNHAVNSEIEINPEEYSDNIEYREYDYEICYGFINLICSSEEEGNDLCEKFTDIADMRCDIMYFENGVAYCEFESE